MTDIQTVIVPLFMLAGVIYVACGSVYRIYWQKTGESFDWKKGLTTFVWVTATGGVLYYVTGTIPTADQILTTLAGIIPQGVPAPGVVTVLIALVHQYVIKGSSATTTTTGTTSTVTSDSSTTNWSPGFSVTPAFSAITSGSSVGLHITGGADSNGQMLKTVCIDWNDGSAVQDVALDTQGFAAVQHTYSYQQGASKYAAKSFYPTFTFTLADASTREFNTSTTGRCCEVEVSSSK